MTMRHQFSRRDKAGMTVTANVLSDVQDSRGRVAIPATPMVVTLNGPLTVQAR